MNRSLKTSVGASVGGRGFQSRISWAFLNLLAAKLHGGNNSRNSGAGAAAVGIVNERGNSNSRQWRRFTTLPTSTHSHRRYNDCSTSIPFGYQRRFLTIAEVQQPQGGPDTPRQPYKVRRSRPVVLDVRLTEAARTKMTTMQRKQGLELYLRLRVSNGGCAGFKYKFSQEFSRQADDCLVAADETKLSGLLVDPFSAQFLNGCEVDFRDNLLGSAFEVSNNPMVRDACSCGTSFTLDPDSIEPPPGSGP